MERTIDEKAGVLEIERVFDVSIIQLKSVSIWNKRISLNLKQLEGR